MTLTIGTPVEDHRERHGLWVKREDLCCPPPGPPFSKMRGVMAHVAARPEYNIGVLDTSHSQAGHAVAYACSQLGKKCFNFLPVRKADADPNYNFLRPRSYPMQNQRAVGLGAELIGLPAGRSAILFHQAKKALAALDLEGGTYMMPNALKLGQMISETAKEARSTFSAGQRFNRVIIACSSATIAAGVMRGFLEAADDGHCHTGETAFWLHQGYSRPLGAMDTYIKTMTGRDVRDLARYVVDEGYSYADKARPGPEPDWPCNPFYDLKAYRWWQTQLKNTPGLTRGDTLLWNIG